MPKAQLDLIEEFVDKELDEIISGTVLRGADEMRKHLKNRGTRDILMRVILGIDTLGCGGEHEGACNE